MNLLIAPIHYDSFVAMKFYLLLHPAMLVPFLVAQPVISFGPWAKKLDVAGRVVDPESGKPIPNAKVIISAWDWEPPLYDRSPHKFLVTTDPRGEFQLARKFDFFICNMTIEASSPDGRYASLGSSSDIDFWFRHKTSSRKGVNRYFYFPGTGEFELSVYELPERDKRYRQLKYETFTGGLGGEPEIVAR